MQNNPINLPRKDDERLMDLEEVAANSETFLPGRSEGLSPRAICPTQ